MIRTTKRLVATDGGDNKEYVEYTCLASDTKPTTGIINGSIATEIDTGKVFFFDETAGEWIEQFSFQNAGGGGGGGGACLPLADISTEKQETDVMTFTDGTTRYLVPEWYYPTAGDDDTIVNTKYYVNGSEVLFKQTSDSQVESTDNAYTIIVDTDIETSNSYFVVTAPQYPVTLKIEGAAIYWVSAFNVPLAICRAASAGETLLELFVGDTTGRECFTVSVSHESIGWLIADTQITDEEKQLPNILGEYYIDGMADDYGYTFYVDFSVVQDAIQIAISTKLSAPMNNTTLGEYLLTLDDSFIGLPLTL